MMYGGSLSLQRTRVRDDVSVEFRDMDLDQRLPTSTRGSLATAVADLADLGVRPGRYSGVEHTFTAGGCLTSAIEPSTCEITADGFLVVTSRGTGDTTTFAWANDRWRWSPYAGVTVEAIPRRVGAIVLIEVFSCEAAKQGAVARLLLAADN